VRRLLDPATEQITDLSAALNLADPDYLLLTNMVWLP